MAICVLSPISAKKKASTVVPSTPSLRRLLPSRSSSILSGIKVQTAMPRKPRPKPQRKTCGLSRPVIHEPKAPAKAWLARVAIKMPRQMGKGLRKRAASKKASSWVLSPISASATRPVETRKASISVFRGRLENPMTTHTPAAKQEWVVKGLARQNRAQTVCSCCRRHDPVGSIVLTRARKVGGGYSPMTLPF